MPQSTLWSKVDKVTGSNEEQRRCFDIYAQHIQPLQDKILYCIDDYIGEGRPLAKGSEKKGMLRSSLEAVKSAILTDQAIISGDIAAASLNVAKIEASLKGLEKRVSDIQASFDLFVKQTESSKNDDTLRARNKYTSLGEMRVNNFANDIVKARAQNQGGQLAESTSPDYLMAMQAELLKIINKYGAPPEKHSMVSKLSGLWAPKGILDNPAIKDACRDLEFYKDKPMAVNELKALIEIVSDGFEKGTSQSHTRALVDLGVMIVNVSSLVEQQPSRPTI